MSDIEDDIDDQLLELAGATEKKKRRRQPSGGSGNGPSKKRRADRMDSDSEKDGPESEEDMQDLYPLEGKYKDEADKRELLAMNEFQREQILEERAAARQQVQKVRMLADLVKSQQRGGAAGAEDSVSRAAKRSHTRGSTKEKAHKLDELKAKRKAKDDKKRPRGSSPSRDRSSSPQDMDISDSESEDGQISKMEQEDERLLNLGLGLDSPNKRGRAGGKEEAETPCTMADMEQCRLTRDGIAKHCVMPWFQDYVTGAWVRYLIGQEGNGQPVYRICQVNNLAPDFVKPYKINDKTVNQAFELKHGKSMRTFNMDKVSNGPITDKEYDRLTNVYKAEGVKLPTKQALEKKVAHMQKLVSQPMTENDINAMLARKNQLAVHKDVGLSTVARSMLHQERTLALRRQDYSEVSKIDAKLAEDAAKHEPSKSEPVVDKLALVNERNRKANMEAVRKAEMAEAERKRRERKQGGQSKGTPTPVDPSARLKILPRTFTPTATRPGTPAAIGEAATVAAVGPVKNGNSFEAALIDSIEIDLGDF